MGQHFTITITPEKTQAQANEVKDLDNTPSLFGIWQDRADMQDIDAYVRQLR